MDYRLDVVATALADLRGMFRLGVGFARGSIQVSQLRGDPQAGPRGGLRSDASGELPMQIARFTVIGVASTIAYIVLFLMFRVVMSAQAAPT
jgi:hypothetical protein